VDSHAVIVGRLPPVRRAAEPVEKIVTPSRLGRLGRRRGLRLIGRFALNLVFVAMMACVVIMLGPAVAGYQRYVILTGSMTGTYDRGSIVYDKQVPTASLKVGDPITYSPPPGFTSQGRVTHRIYSIRRGPNGERIFKTKGDANKHPDAWNFTLDRATAEQVKFHIPEVGYIFLLLSIQEFRIIIVGVPAVIIGLVMLAKLWREGGEAARRQKLAELGWRTLVDPGSGAVLVPVQVAATEQVHPRLDLRLPRAPPGPPSDTSGTQPAARPRLDLSRPLRIRPLTPGGAIGSASAAGGAWDAGGAPAAGEAPVRHGAPVGAAPLAAGATVATRRLRVSRIAA
jgi:signal peptidase